MTGEISLRGLVLPVGGIKRVMLPARNRKDLEDVPPQARQQLEFIFLDHIEEAVQSAIQAENPHNGE